MKNQFKKLITLSALVLYLLISVVSFAQVPQKFNYQGIARDVKGNPIGKQTLALKLSVLPTEDASVAEYEETQIVTTNEFGLYTLQIGNGSPLIGDMKTVKWETGNKYIRVAIDPKGGNDYTVIGTSQLLSVPYAIYADKAGLARETVGQDGKTRTGAVSSNASHVAGDANYVTKFTGLNVIGKSLIYDNGARVGIGTTTPLASGLLHLKSPIGTQPLILESPQGVHNLVQENGVNRGYFGSYIGSGGAYPTPAGTSDADFDIGTSGASTGKLHFATNTTPRVTILPSTGNVGIGTTSPTTKLEVVGQVKITGGAPGAGKVLTSDASGLATWQTPASGGSSKWTNTGNNISNNNTGNVGIGNTIIDNTAYGHGGTNKILEINNNGSSANSQSQLVLSTDATSGGSIGGITWVNKNTAAPELRSAFIGAAYDDLNQDATELSFWTRESTGGLSQKMNIGSDGRVRIEGPTIPSSGMNAVSVGGNGHVGVDAPGIINGRFVVLDNGNVGIGNAAPSAKLDVNGYTQLNGSALVAPNATTGSTVLVVGDNPSLNAFYKMQLTPHIGQSGLLINGNSTSDYGISSYYEGSYENGLFRNSATAGKSTSVSAINFSSNDTASCYTAWAPDGATGLKIETHAGTNGGQGINVRSKNKQAIIASAAKQAAYIVTTPTVADANLNNGALEVNMNSTISSDYTAIWGRNFLVPNYGIGIKGSGGYIGIQGRAETVGSGARYGVSGIASGGTTSNFGVYGYASGTGAFGGYFDGNVHVTGNLSKAGGTFKIDHPQDPANKYLIHSFVESPDMMNVYNGNITTDANGYAVVSLPGYFETENKDFKYQLTVIDNSNDFVMAKIIEEVNNNSFKIKSSKPNVKISWQVTGVRQDAWANANRVVAEVEKNEQEKGKYLHPELHGQPSTKSVTYHEKNIK